MLRKQHANSEQMARVSVHDITVELGLPLGTTRRLLRKHGWWMRDGRRCVGPGKAVTYDAEVIEKLRGLLGQEYRSLEDPADDWLSNYIGGI